MWGLLLNRCSMRKKKKRHRCWEYKWSLSCQKWNPPRSSQLGTMPTATTQGSLCQHMVRVIWKRRGFWGHQIGIQTLGLTNRVLPSMCSISMNFKWLLYKNKDKNNYITKQSQAFQLHRHINVSNMVFSTSRCSKNETLLFSIIFLFRQNYVAAIVCNHIWVFDS